MFHGKLLNYANRLYSIFPPYLPDLLWRQENISDAHKARCNGWKCNFSKCKVHSRKLKAAAAADYISMHFFCNESSDRREGWERSWKERFKDISWGRWLVIIINRPRRDGGPTSTHIKRGRVQGGEIDSHVAAYQWRQTNGQSDFVLWLELRWQPVWCPW